MIHETKLSLWDVIFTTYIPLVITPVFIMAWVAFSLIFTYQSNYYLYIDDKSLLIIFGVFGVMYYYVSIQLFMFFWSCFLCLINPKLKRGVLGIHKFEIANEGLIEETEFNKTISKWSSIDKAIKIFGYILVRVAGHQWHTFPKRSFESTEQQAEFYELLRNKIRA